MMKLIVLEKDSPLGLLLLCLSLSSALSLHGTTKVLCISFVELAGITQQLSFVLLVSVMLRGMHSLKME
jgi:hypothetical protein